MTKSKLTDSVILADSSNYTHGRDGKKICKITPHMMAGKLTGKQCARIFQNKNRDASANYCIGYNGDICLSVPEEYRAWTSSSRSNDCQAITIEVSNSKNNSAKEGWPVSDKSWKALVELCVDICKRYNFKLVYDKTPNGSLTRHNMFADTDCPGKYLQNRFPQLVKEVNAKLDNKSTVGEKRKIKACTIYSNPDLTGKEYQYKDNTTVRILKNVNKKVDYVKVIVTGRKGYIDVKNYK